MAIGGSEAQMPAMKWKSKQCGSLEAETPRMRAIFAMHMVWVILLHGASPNAGYQFGATVLRFQAWVWGTQLAISICSDCRAELVSNVADAYPLPSLLKLRLCSLIRAMRCNSIPLFETKHKLAASG